MSQASQPHTVPDSPDQLLKMGADAARSGNRPAARSLFLALAREYPEDVRVWIGLAGVAASRNERREALERVVALDPANERARAALARLAGAPTELADSRATVVLPETLAPTPPHGSPMPPQPDQAPRDGEAAPQRAPFPLMNAIAMGLILLLLGAVGVILGRALLGDGGSAARPAATPTLSLQPAPSGAQAPAATTAPPLDEPTTGAPTSAPPAPTASQAATTPPPSASSSATPPATTAPAPAEALAVPMGTPIDYDGWTAVLVRPDYAVSLDGAIGDLQPAGRFVLAVVAVSNNSSAPRVIPPDLFLLVDSAGRSFAPVPGASTAYLSLYERAQRGDLALEDTFDPVVGLRSVPLIFDVPIDASGLRLTVKGAGPAGWLIDGSGPSPAPSGP